MPPQPDPSNRGCLQVLAILVGLVLLLPGLCGIIIAGLDPHELRVDPAVASGVFGLISLGVIGVILIWWAVRRR
jgi:hypothetical protein